MYQDDKTGFWKSIDWVVLIVYVLLCIIGCLSIYGASYDFENPGFFDFDQRSGKQFIWFALALVIGLVILFLDSNFFFNWSFIFYFAMLGLLAITIFVASDIKGSNSWLVIGPLQVQPAEFSKFATALALSRLMGSYNFNLNNNRNIILISLMILSPMLLIFLQNETGSALVFASFMLMLYREGMPGFILFAFLCLAAFFVLGLKFADVMIFGHTSLGSFIVLTMIILIVAGMMLVYRKDTKTAKLLIAINAIPLLIAIILNLFNLIVFDINILQLILLGITALFLVYQSLSYRVSVYFLTAIFSVFSTIFLYSTEYAFDNILEPHQQIRISVLLGLKDDPRGSSYNVNQSKIAIGSGGFSGKGFLNGTQTKLKYVPEQDTDFIFCTVGEEQGFIGAIVVLSLYLTLLLRLMFLAERQKSAFSRIYGYCVVSIFLFHVLINVGMVLGLLPVIGIPLPFLSYGGSSLWAFTILLFIFLRLDADRSLQR